MTRAVRAVGLEEAPCRGSSAPRARDRAAEERRGRRRSSSRRRPRERGRGTWGSPWWRACPRCRPRRPRARRGCRPRPPPNDRPAPTRTRRGREPRPRRRPRGRPWRPWRAVTKRASACAGPTFGRMWLSLIQGQPRKEREYYVSHGYSIRLVGGLGALVLLPCACGGRLPHATYTPQPSSALVSRSRQRAAARPRRGDSAGGPRARGRLGRRGEWSVAPRTVGVEAGSVGHRARGRHLLSLGLRARR